MHHLFQKLQSPKLHFYQNSSYLISARSRCYAWLHALEWIMSQFYIFISGNKLHDQKGEYLNRIWERQAFDI